MLIPRDADPGQLVAGFVEFTNFYVGEGSVVKCENYDTGFVIHEYSDESTFREDFPVGALVVFERIDQTETIGGQTYKLWKLHKGNV